VESEGEVKSVGREETFPTDLTDAAALGRALLSLLSVAMAELRHSGHLARTLTVKVKDADFTQRQKSRTLPSAVESERALWPLAQALLGELRLARRGAVRLLGVSLSGLVAKGAVAALPAHQLTLFPPAAQCAAPALPPAALAVATGETARDRTLARLGDAIRSRFGDAALQPATCTDPSHS
jgi:DNA polymerase-4